jgi:nucleotide-binding universal stress UspA family protein
MPVLAVDADMTNPRTVVAAIDFSPASITAAETALRLINPPATIYLVYVEPPAELLPAGFSLPVEDRFSGDLAASFRRVTERLCTRAGILVETCVLTGRPIPCLLDFVERVGADLIAAGSHGFSRIERLVLGSVSEDLVKKAPCSVLVAPARQ